MSRPPVSEEIAATFARFYRGGAGPTHPKLTAAIRKSGYTDADPWDPATKSPSKEVRVVSVIQAATRAPVRARELMDALLRDLRADGNFDDGSVTADALRRAQAAFSEQGWNLSQQGHLTQDGPVNLDTGGRPALDEQLHRLQRSVEDPALALGSAKDLLEAVAKFVLHELDWPLEGKPDFAQSWYFARERLNLLPQQVPNETPGAKNIKAILQSAWKIAEQVNELRNLQGTGHGRTLPTGVSPELARLVVREACSVAEFTLSALDRAKGQPMS
ncbi:abortive infection family protein [Rhodococcus sp. GG48]|nr:abortive infection family protein [Rhodococcus sp. GG48]